MAHSTHFELNEWMSQVSWFAVQMQFFSAMEVQLVVNEREEKKGTTH